MQLSSVIKDQRFIVKVSGQFVAKNIIAKRQQLESYQQQAGKVLLFDLSDVKLIDSSGIGMLAYLCKRLKILNIELVIIGLNNQPLELFKSLNLNNLFNCYRNYQSYCRQITNPTSPLFANRLPT